MTKNMAVGESVYGEKRIAVEDEAGKIEYRVWNPFRSKLAAAVLGGVDKFTCRLAARSCILELPVEPQLATCQILLVQKVWSMLLNSVTGPEEIC